MKVDKKEQQKIIKSKKGGKNLCFLTQTVGDRFQHSKGLANLYNGLMGVLQHLHSAWDMDGKRILYFPLVVICSYFYNLTLSHFPAQIKQTLFAFVQLQDHQKPNSKQFMIRLSIYSSAVIRGVKVSLTCLVVPTQTCIPSVTNLKL